MKIDVRFKLLIFFAVSGAAFAAKDILFGGAVFTVIVFLAFYMGQWKQALTFIASYLSLTGLVLLCPYLPRVLGSIILMLALCMRMFMPVLLYAKIFLATTTISEMVTAMYAMKIPRAFVITFAVAMRFFPTAKEELNHIRHAMHLRGIGFTFKNVVTHPLVLAEGFITPLMVRASTIADELSVSSITRGIDNPGTRTAFFRLHISATDVVATVTVLFLIMGIMAAKYWT